jgi:hypothetical protein
MSCCRAWNVRTTTCGAVVSREGGRVWGQVLCEHLVNGDCKDNVWSCGVKGRGSGVVNTGPGVGPGTL